MSSPPTSERDLEIEFFRMSNGILCLLRATPISRLYPRAHHNPEACGNKLILLVSYSQLTRTSRWGTLSISSEKQTSKE